MYFPFTIFCRTLCSAGKSKVSASIDKEQICHGSLDVSQVRCQNNNTVGIISIGGEKQLEGREDNRKCMNPISYSEVAKRHSAASPDSPKAGFDSRVHVNVSKSKHYENDTEDSKNSILDSKVTDLVDTFVIQKDCDGCKTSEISHNAIAKKGNIATNGLEQDNGFIDGDHIDKSSNKNGLERKFISKNNEIPKILKCSDSDVFENIEDKENIQLSSVSDACNLKANQGSKSIPRQSDSSNTEVQHSGHGPKDDFALTKHDQVGSSTTKSLISFPYMQVSQNVKIY